MGLSDVARRLVQLQMAMAECDRLDAAAGEMQPKLSVGVWVRQRLNAAALATTKGDSDVG